MPAEKWDDISRPSRPRNTKEAESLSDKLGLWSAYEVADAAAEQPLKTVADIIRADRLGVVRAVARWLESECNSPKRATDVRRELLGEEER